LLSFPNLSARTLLTLGIAIPLVLWLSAKATPGINFILISIVLLHLHASSSKRLQEAAAKAYSYSATVTLHPNWLAISRRLFPTFHDEVLEKILLSLEQADQKQYKHTYNAWNTTGFSHLVLYNSIGRQNIVWNATTSSVSSDIEPIFFYIPDSCLSANNITISPAPCQCFLYPSGVVFNHYTPPDLRWPESEDWQMLNTKTFSEIPFNNIMMAIVEDRKRCDGTSFLDDADWKSCLDTLEVMHERRTIPTKEFPPYPRCQRDIKNLVDGSGGFEYKFSTEYLTLRIEIHAFNLWNLNDSEAESSRYANWKSKFLFQRKYASAQQEQFCDGNVSTLTTNSH
jgi:hypothetical protein